MRFLRSNDSKFFTFVADNLHYGGLLLVIALALQTYVATRLSEQSLQSSIDRQQELRDLLWTNLLTHRATVMAMSALVDKTGHNRSEAVSILESIPSVVSRPEGVATRGVEKVKDILMRPPTAENSRRLLAAVDEIGQKLNANESEQWFKLLDDNEKLLQGLQSRRYYAFFTYALVVFFVLSLGAAIHRRKRAEKYLIESEKQARALADASFEGIAICIDGKIVEVNQAFQNLFEVESEEAISKPIDHFIISRSHKSDEEQMGRRKKSSPIPIEISVKESEFQGDLSQIVAIRDLSERREAETMRHEKEAAERANRAKSMFLANMSHELRTPMHGVLSFARFGIRDSVAGKTDHLRNYFEEIFSSGSQLMRLLNDVLDLSKLEAGKMDYSMESADLIVVIEKVIAEMSAFAAEKNIGITHKKSEGPAVAVLDQIRIAQVIRNLISNAIKFSDPSTEILCEVVRQGNNFQFYVTNRGKCIPAEERENVFNKFFQSSATRTGAGGTGLGLAICKEIIQQHKGKIWTDSPAEGSTRFVFEIPVDVMEMKYG